MTNSCTFREGEKAPSFLPNKTACFPSEVTTRNSFSQLTHYFTWRKPVEKGVITSLSLHNIKHAKNFFWQQDLRLLRVMENITGKLMFKAWKLSDYVGLETAI